MVCIQLTKYSKKIYFRRSWLWSILNGRHGSKWDRSPCIWDWTQLSIADHQSI